MSEEMDLEKVLERLKIAKDCRRSIPVDDALNDATQLAEEVERWRKLYDASPKHPDGLGGNEFISIHNRMVMEWTKENAKLRKAYDLSASVVAELTNQETEEDKTRLCTEIAKQKDANEIARLRARDRVLSALEAGGVDNWEGYEASLEEFFTEVELPPRAALPKDEPTDPAS